jgi:hypothetical protein
MGRGRMEIYRAGVRGGGVGEREREKERTRDKFRLCDIHEEKGERIEYQWKRIENVHNRMKRNTVEYRIGVYFHIEQETTLHIEPETTFHIEPETTFHIEPETTLHIEPETTFLIEPETTFHIEPQTTLILSRLQRE